MKSKELIAEIKRIAEKELYCLDFTNLEASTKEQLQSYLLAARAPDFLIEAAFAEWAKAYPKIAEEIKDHYLRHLWARNMVLEWAFYNK